MSAWENIKKFVVDKFYKNDDNENCLKPELMDIDDQTDFKYELFNWLRDVEMHFGNTRKFEERIKYCEEIIDLFAWNADSPDNYKSAIGESLNNLKRFEECDNWFEKWLLGEPDNPSCLNSFVFCLIDRNEIERAKDVIEKYIDKSECTIDNMIMFIRAKSLYEAIGDIEKAKKYEDIIEKCNRDFLNNPINYSSEDYDESVFYNKPIVKDKKIGRNEPCPCGSGKKYKKCCGK